MAREEGKKNKPVLKFLGKSVTTAKGKRRGDLF